MAAALPSVRSYLGIAKEVTPATPVAATDFIPISKDAFKPVDIIAPLYDTGLRGSMVENYTYIQGRRHTEIDLAGPVFADTVGWWLGGILGSVVTTGGSAPYTHAITLKNATGIGADAQPTSLTLEDMYVAENRYYPGCKVTEFSMTFNSEGMLEYTAKLMGHPSTTTAVASPSFSAVTPTPVWRGTVSIGGVSVGYTTDGSVSMTRKAEAIFGINIDQGPYEVFVGALDSTGSLTFVRENDDELINFLDNTQPALEFTWAQGAGATATSVAFTVTKGAYTTAAIDRSGDHVAISIEFSAIGNTTDAGATGGYAPIAWELQNAVTSGTYQ
jgi:Phage tail tube protein